MMAFTIESVCTVFCKSKDALHGLFPDVHIKGKNSLDSLGFLAVLTYHFISSL